MWNSSCHVWNNLKACSSDVPRVTSWNWGSLVKTISLVIDFFFCSYAWVLQDILGITFCISLIRNIRLPNLKVCTILLVLLLIYDIFFVFITPFFSAGKSVMVEVATGKDCIWITNTSVNNYYFTLHSNNISFVIIRHCCLCRLRNIEMGLSFVDEMKLLFRMKKD